MQSLVPSSRGFVADVRPARITIRSERKPRRGWIVIGVIVLSFVLTAGLLPRDEKRDSTESAMSQPSPPPSDYAWRVYFLNQSHMVAGTHETSFLFNMDDLPFAFESIAFGDFRTDAEHLATYYGGCGILVDAGGETGTVVLKEGTGKLVASVQYLGQDLIVFSGERRSASYPVASTSYYGTDKMIEDWRNGTWSPSIGVVLEHAQNVSLYSATFCLMVFEPGPVLVPELNNLLIVVVFTPLIVFLVRRRMLA